MSATGTIVHLTYKHLQSTWTLDSDVCTVNSMLLGMYTEPSEET
jgi:hypothetical protein